MIIIYILLTIIFVLITVIYFVCIKNIKLNIKDITNDIQKVYVFKKDIDSSILNIKQELLVINDKIKTIKETMKEPSNNVEKFLFFSDPHPFVSYDKVEWAKDTKFNRMKEYLDNLGYKFIICCGDFLTDHNKQTAIDDLKLANKVMVETFGDKYYLLLGNHDNNDKNEEVSHDEIVKILFSKWGKAYYTFKGDCTRFYVFDSDSIPHLAMDDYKKEQAKWFAESLIKNDDEHIAIVIHMAQIMDDGGPISSEQVTQLSLIAKAFNNKVSYDDYDFKNTKGKVHVILAGHWHEDNNYILNDIPVYIIDDAQEGNFDIVLIDYNNNQLRTIRVGDGENRIIKI